MNEKLDSGDAGARRGYVRSIIDAVDVDDHAVRISRSRDILQAAIAGKQIENGNVCSFVRKWRTRRDSNPWPLPSEGAGPACMLMSTYSLSFISHCFLINFDFSWWLEIPANVYTVAVWWLSNRIGAT
ncbi:MAG: hypothetical protein WDN46_03160 [Methylocella sp.]